MNSKYKINLRETLSKNLNRLIGNSEIEAKELAAFDIIMDRREFLKAAQLTALGALVASVYPPSAWGRFDKNLHVPPKTVGLTASDMASVSQATQLVTGTELFQDTIYAQPVVATNAINSHALIEGARGRSRIQSDLVSTNPDEYQFLDRDYHFGLPELIQLEKDANGDWELVHYRHPWNARTDGARTDGLEREVIMTKDNGLTDPVKVLAVTGTYTNRFYPQQANQASSLSYLVFVEESTIAGHILVGQGISSVPPPYNELPVYPIKWVSGSVNKVNWEVDPGPFLFSDKYTSSAWLSSADNAATEYIPERQVEHLILYYKTANWIITLLDTGDPDPGIMATIVVYPVNDDTNNFEYNARIVHIDWDPTQGKTGNWPNITNIVWGSSEKASNGDVTYSLFAQNISKLPIAEEGFFEAPVRYSIIPVGGTYQHRKTTIPAAELQNGDLELDYSSVRSIHGLHTTITDGNWYHVKVANFEGRGTCLLTITKEGPPDEVKSSPAFYPGGHFPLAFPDAAGLGTINVLSGGTSKFGGYRFVASDADGNVFLMRQRRSTDIDSPYAPPIYAQYGADGTLKTSWSATPLPLPDTTSSTSNLNDLQAWVAASAPGLNYVYNFLLDAALAFATDDTSESQAVWLGNSYQAAYASKRFALDSEHVVVKQVKNGDTDIYAAYTMFKNPVDKTWIQRQIATQILPQGPGLQETGDHYQATVTPANVYGKPVSLIQAGNENLLIEVRADSPCTVIDDTNNFYYDIDRYTSFMAAPDPGSGRLCLLVKAETFSQVVYVRLVDTSGLQPSSDAAMLSSTDSDVYPWQSVNLALQAQQRMGNGAAPSSLLGDDMPLADTTVYVDGGTLAQSNPDTPWKGNYNQSDMTANLGNLATYLNTSGQNLISATGQLSLGASPNGVTIDPLYAVTSVPPDSSRTALTIQFDYLDGEVIKNPPQVAAITAVKLGSIFSSISHALHDALHWLQHVEASAYKDLASDGVKLISSAESITVLIKSDIMKQVNGVEDDLNEVVNTVEEYASVVANLVVTIVESSFIYTFIKAIIALISLFQHFEDILTLSKSFATLFTDMVNGTNNASLPSIPGNFSSWDIASPYLGSGSNATIDSALGGVNSSSVSSTLITSLVDSISGNPLTKKILNKVTSTVSSLLNDFNPPLPLNFDMDLTAVQSVMDDISNLEDNLIAGVTTLGEDIVNSFINQIIADIANPQKTFQNLTSPNSGLGTLAEALNSDVLSPIFDFVDTYTKSAPAVAASMINYDKYLTLNITVLVDLCRLFKIGSVSGNELNLKASETIFFPLALIAWVAAYINTGNSIKDVSELDSDLNLPSGEVGISGAKLWDIVHLGVDFVMTELIAVSWWVKTLLAISNGNTPTSIQKLFTALGAWFNWTRWMNDIVYTSATWDPATGKPFDYAWAATRLATACTDVAFTLPLKNYDPGTGWPKDPRSSDLSQAVNFLMNLAVIAYDAVEFGKTNPNSDQITLFVGKILPRLQIDPAFLYNVTSPYFKGYVDTFATLMLVCPIGFGLQIYVQAGGPTAPPPSGPGNNPPGKHRRRRRRPHEDDSKHRRGRFAKERNWWD